MVFGLAEIHGDLVHLDGIKLQKVNCCKYMGIFIDCNMKWSEHIDYIYNKLIKFVGIKFFYKLRNKLPIAIILRDIFCICISTSHIWNRTLWKYVSFLPRQTRQT